ncbi:MAG: DUF2489 domain-containing protein [Cellvibrionaceae bacterium]
MLVFLSIVGAIIVLVLAVIAWRLQSRVHKMERAKKQQVEELDELKDNHQQYLNNSIQVLAQGLVDDQLSLTEGAIRISVLLDNLKITENTKEDYSAFFQLADATAHIPILNAWKKLPKKEKFRFENERLEIEEKYREFVVDAATRIRGKVF